MLNFDNTNALTTLRFYLNKEIIDVLAIASNNSRLSLRFNKRERRLETLVPIGTSELVVRRFIEPHLPRFVKLMQKVIERAPFSLAEEFIFILGRRYVLKVLIGFAKPELVKRGGVFYLMCHAASEEELVFAITEYAKVHLNVIISRELPRLELALNTGPHSFKIMSMRSAWGVNYVAERRLGFHTSLMHYQLATIKYVIVHELVHDAVPGHSEAFWKLLSSYYPSYEAHRAILRHNKDIGEE